MDSLNEVWAQVLEILSGSLTQVAITTWFGECKAIDLTGERFVLQAPSEFKKTIIETRFSKNLRSAMYDIFSCDLDITILDPAEAETYRSSNKKKTSDKLSEYVFENFVVGSSNKFAYAAARAVAEETTKKYNPLFIYGESGLGKTHLLYSIQWEMRKNHPEFNIIYVKGEEFMNELISSIQSGRTPEFREKYRHSDLFLVDDIQIVAGKSATQDEFFHTFNTLYESNCQIVFTSDRPPQEIPLLADRLKTRFESGLVADIQPPNYETRVAIINNKSSQIGLFLTEDVADYIATKITSNVRQIEGAVKKLFAYRELMGEEINLTTASRIIKDMFMEKTEDIPTPDIIIEETAKYFGLSVEDVKGDKRMKPIAFARQISMYLIRKITNLPLKDIGNVYDKDHTTVLSSIRRIEEDMRTSNDLNQTIKDITSNINSRK